MWATTGSQGWQLPQSVAAATWLGIAGIVVIVIGLVIARPVRGSHIAGRVPVLALAIACAGSLFLAVWSAQPAYWAGVGASGPSVLPVFSSDTASPSLPIRYGHNVDTIEAARELRLFPRTVRREASVSLAVLMGSVESPTGVGYPQPISVGASIPLRSLPGDAKVSSLWVEVVVGRGSWTTPSSVRGESLPVLVSGGEELRASDSSWLTSGWVALTYNLPVRVGSHRQPIAITLRGKKNTMWQGGRSARWVAVGVHAMALPLTLDGGSFNARISASPPSVFHPAEQVGVATGLPVHQRLTVIMPTGSPQDPTLVGASLNLPTTSFSVDNRTGPAALLLIGLAYVTLIGAGSLGGAWVISRRDIDGYPHVVAEGDGGQQA